MRRTTFVLALLALLATACGDEPATSAPTGPTSPTVTSVTISGTLTIGNIGLTSQLTATAHLAKGTTQDVTSQATWTSSNTNIATVSAGTVVATNVGAVTITAVYQNVTGSTRVTITRPLTYTLSGVVTESVPTTSTVLPGARVELMDGVNQGRFAVADASGRYELTGAAAGSFSIHATQAGYTDVTQQVTISANTTLNFALVPTPATLWRSFYGQISGTSPVCYQNYPCQVFNLAVHNTGPVVATLPWNDSWNGSGASLGLQLYNADTGQLLASSTTDQELSAQIQAAGNYQLRVVGLTVPSTLSFRLNATSYPN